MCFGNAFRLVNEVSGFLDLGLKRIKGSHVGLDLVNWKLDEHTSDLWSSILWYQQVNVFEDNLTNLILQVWVSVGNRWEELLSSKRIFLLWSHLGWAWSSLWNTWHSWLTHLWHTLAHTWLWWHLILHSWLWWHSLVVWHALHLSTHWLLLHVMHVLTLMVLSVATMLSSLVITSTVWLSWSTSHLSFIVVEMSVHGFVLLHDLKQLLKNLGHVWMSNQVVQMESTILLGLIFLKVRFVHSFFSLESSKLLNLVMVNHKSLTFNGVVVEGNLGRSSSIWGLEADESI